LKKYKKLLIKNKNTIFFNEREPKPKYTIIFDWEENNTIKT